MAKQTVVTYIDDVDGTEATGTIQFGLDGKTYEIDLSDENAQALQSLLSPWIEHARKVGTSASTRSRGRKGKGYDPIKVRAWARSQGIIVGDRGRINDSILTAYFAGHAS